MDEFWQDKNIFQSFTEYSRLSHRDSTIQSTFVYTIDLALDQPSDKGMTGQTDTVTGSLMKELSGIKDLEMDAAWFHWIV